MRSLCGGTRLQETGDQCIQRGHAGRVASEETDARGRDRLLRGVDRLGGNGEKLREVDAGGFERVLEGRQLGFLTARLVHERVDLLCLACHLLLHLVQGFAQLHVFVLTTAERRGDLLLLGLHVVESLRQRIHL